MNENLIFDLGNLEKESKYLRKRNTENVLLKNFSYKVRFPYTSYLFLKLKQRLFCLFGKKTIHIEQELLIF